MLVLFVEAGAGGSRVLMSSVDLSRSSNSSTIFHLTLPRFGGESITPLPCGPVDALFQSQCVTMEASIDSRSHRSSSIAQLYDISSPLIYLEIRKILQLPRDLMVASHGLAGFLESAQA